METLLVKHLEEIKNLEEKKCWYIVKQDVEFYKQCYYVKILLDYLKSNKEMSLEDYFKSEVDILNGSKPSLKLTTTHRALRVAYFYGLISYTTDTQKYENSQECEVYRKILEVTNGDFEKEENYKEIKLEQLEKIFISSNLDKEYLRTRADFKIFPVIFLYKILLELGKTKNKYEISKEEYKYILTLQKNYYNYLDALVLIKESRELENPFESIKEKDDVLDNRFNLIIEQLDTIETTNKSYILKLEYLDRVKNLVNEFENKIINNDNFQKNYLEFIQKPLQFNINNKTLKSDIKIYQKIIYGAPGTGKSYFLSKETNKMFASSNIERVTFYDGYSYGQFVGMYKPVSDDENNIIYKYVPGPLMRILVKALNNPNEDFCLIIEEINRAKADKVFGNIFQLLDRNSDGESRYKISVSEEQESYLSEKGINVENGLYLPKNLYIWATMNSADEGVQPLDTAFKRRWKFKYMSLNEKEEEFLKSKDGRKLVAFKTATDNILWNNFRKVLNSILSSNHITEDKLLAPFFISPNDFEEVEEIEILNQDVFIEKVLMYIYDDLLRHYPKAKKEIFSEEIKTFSDIYEKSKDSNFENIFNDSFKEKIKSSAKGN